MNYFLNEKNFKLIFGNSMEVLDQIPDESVDMIFADPPYFLSNNGITCHAGKMVSVNKGTWDQSEGFKKDYEFTKKWITKCRKILKNNGTIWISGTLHIIYKTGFILEELGFKILNDIIWFKPNASPNLSCRYFTHSHETLLWAKKNHKSKHTFNYEIMKNYDVSRDIINNQGKQMRSVWSIPLTPKKEKINGKHPTQKPIELLKRIILSSTNTGDIILDPFNGSGTTGIVAVMTRRSYIGIEINKDYLEITKKRYFEVKEKEKENKKIKKLDAFISAI